MSLFKDVQHADKEVEQQVPSLVGIQNDTATWGENLAHSYKHKNIFSIWFKNCSPRYLPKWVENLSL